MKIITIVPFFFWIMLAVSLFGYFVFGIPGLVAFVVLSILLLSDK